MSALTPKIVIEDRPHLTVCNTCGEDDGTVRSIAFRWTDNSNPRRVHGGGTAVALCAHCRELTAQVLADEVKP